jgi:uncharacterized coiled-coil protein SlyX
MKPTYQQLEDLCGRQENQIAQQAQRIKELEGLLKKAFDRIAVLEEQVSALTEKLGKNSKNSSKPPSTDQKRNTRVHAHGYSTLPGSASRKPLSLQSSPIATAMSSSFKLRLLLLASPTESATP